MPKFIYKAKQGARQITEGVVEADNFDNAVARILQLGYVPFKVDTEKELDSNVRRRRASFRLFGFFRRIPCTEIILFTRQISDLVDAGVPILQALGIVKKQFRHVYLKEVVGEMYFCVQDGRTLSAALARFPDVFSPVYINVVKAGEVSGSLSVVLCRLAGFIEQQEEARTKIVMSLLYPALICGAGGVTIFVLLTWVIPRITLIFDDLNEALPVPTMLLLGISDFFARFWWVMAGIIFFVVSYIKRLQSTPRGKMWIDRVKLKLPFIGGFVKDAAVANFACTLATLVGSGVVIVTALKTACLSTENAALRQAAQQACREVAGGTGIAGALQMTAFFDESAVNMIAVGEETGEIHKSLCKVAAYYERRTQRVIKAVTSLVEPVLIIIIGSVVAFVVIAMLMPIFQMNLIIN